MILFGGNRYNPGPPASYSFDAETWQWNGATATWTKLSPGTSPGGRAYPTMVAYRRAGTDKILMVGGVGGSVGTDTTWEWDGAANAGAGNWANRTPVGGPSVRGNPGLAWDSDRQLVAMYGGRDYAAVSPPYDKSDLWTWNGSSWALVTPASPAPARTNAFGFVYDPARRKLVLWGGMEPNTYNPMADVWEWDATGAGTWNERTPSAGAFPARESFAAYYDPVRGAPTMFGGGGNFWDAFKQDTWEWLPGTWRGPRSSGRCRGARPASGARPSSPST